MKFEKKNLEIWKDLKIRKTNLKIREKFGKNWKFGKNLKINKEKLEFEKLLKFGKNLKFDKKKFGNSEKNWKFGKKIGNLERNWKFGKYLEIWKNKFENLEKNGNLKKVESFEKIWQFRNFTKKLKFW